MMRVRPPALRRPFNPFLCIGRTARARVGHQGWPQMQEWPLRTVKIETDLMQYKKLPMGCTFNSKFVDTGSRQDSAPVILLLHDNPGSHLQMGALINSFHNLGARVIATNYPGNSFTKGESYYDDIVFKYSTYDRAYIIDKLIASLGINQVEGVVACGYGCYPALLLLISISNAYRSACFLNFPPLSAPPFPASESLARLVAACWPSSGLARLLLRRLLSRTHTRFEWPLASADETAYCLISHANMDLAMVQTQARDLAALDSPLMLVSTAWDSRAREISATLGCPMAEERPDCLSRLAERDLVVLRKDEEPRHHFFADCSASQVVREPFFTDKIASVFLRLFVPMSKRSRMLW